MNKQILIFLVVLMVLSLGLFFKSKNKNKERSFFNFSQNDVAAFQINYFTQALYFQKNSEGTWVVKKIKNELMKEIETKQKESLFEETLFKSANSSQVETALTHLMQIQKSKAISNGQTNLKEFEINKHSLHVIFYNTDQKVLDKLYVGKAGPEPMSSFVSRGAGQPVYLTTQNLNLFLNQDESKWFEAGVAK